MVFQCEIDPYCRSVLAKHWPHIERFHDVTQPRSYPHVDLVCGGFPCQDVSSAGRGRGLGGGALGCGSTSPASFGKSARDSSSSKTSRAGHRVGSYQSASSSRLSDIERAPWGLPPQTWERRTFGDASSLLPTPTSSTYGSNQGGAAGRVGAARLSLESMARAGMLPTPCVSRKTWNKAAKGSKVDATWPALGMVAGTEGRLSPLFVEWMMGFPEGWTLVESEPSETPSSRSARKSSGG